MKVTQEKGGNFVRDKNVTICWAMRSNVEVTKADVPQDLVSLIDKPQCCFRVVVS